MTRISMAYFIIGSIAIGVGYHLITKANGAPVFAICTGICFVIAGVLEAKESK